EARDLIQKDRIKWDIEGDENSKFFHWVINQKRRSQNITDKFQAHDSEVIFSSLAHSIGLCFSDRDLLETRVSLEEIKTAVWYCGSNKASGPDGFTFGFIKKYWDLLNKDIFEFVNSFFDSGLMPQGANSSFSTLIPKGGPFTPFLFILVMEGLHCAISNAVNSGLIRGIKLSSRYPTYSMLMIIGVPNDEVADMARRTGCASGSFPFTYLRLPIGSNMYLNSSWQILIDRFHKRLSSWKANMLSIGGRLTLIKAVLGSLGIY
ncbi:hypothetical protein Tco_0512300, partial [Tanacetum coccineum]